MNRRTTAIALIACTLFVGTPAFAVAKPAPEPAPRHVTTTRDAALADLVAAYRAATLPEKHRLHQEITVILHHNRDGWTI